MNDTCGPEFCEPFATYDPASSCWRTSQATFPWGSDEYSETWPKQGTWDRGHAYERPSSAPAIDANGCSSLPTPTARDGKSGTDYRGRTEGPDLFGALALLPTPTSNQPGGTAEQHLARKNRMPDGATRTSVTDLRMALQLLPTPTANEAKAGRNRTSGRTNQDSAHHDGTTLTDVAWDWHHSASTSPPSTDGPTSSDDQPPQDSTADASTPDSSSG